MDPNPGVDSSDAHLPTWQPIPPHERRVLGVLIEKQKTSKSPDAYPMTLNSIVLGCNQKSNRDPVVTLDEDDVEEVLRDLQRKGVAVKLTGSRTDRWRHQAYELWRASGPEMAILAELLLRGPQTEGDLRGRASRMDPIADLDTLRELLGALAERKLVVYLTPANRRGCALTHGFHTVEELAAARTQFANTPGDDDTPLPRSPTSASGPGSPLAEITAELEQLKRRVARLESQLGVTNTDLA